MRRPDFEVLEAAGSCRITRGRRATRHVIKEGHPSISRAVLGTEFGRDIGRRRRAWAQSRVDFRQMGLRDLAIQLATMTRAREQRQRTSGSR